MKTFLRRVHMESPHVAGHSHRGRSSAIRPWKRIDYFHTESCNSCSSVIPRCRFRGPGLHVRRKSGRGDGVIQVPRRTDRLP